jgi:hypothetical protein
MKTEYLDEYKPSERVTLRRGDKIRVSKGPYIRLADGEKMRMSATGICTFERAVKTGTRICLVARHSKSGWVVLHVEGKRRNADIPNLVCRPYQVRKVRAKKGVHEKVRKTRKAV